ncbi:MAG: cytochrome c [Caulobacterales bacterium]|nr:cytochrome c [Caulobacterales bacterium]
MIVSVAGAVALAVPTLAVPTLAAAQPTGEQLFNDNCAACHQKTGVGVKGAFPALAADKFVTGPAPQVTATVLVGRGGMPAFKSELSDDQLAAIVSYVRSAWGNKAAPVSAADVAATRSRASALAQPAGLQAH